MSEINKSGQILERLRKISKLGPVPPPTIIRKDEAGPPEDPTSSVPITWIRSSAPLNLYDLDRESQRFESSIFSKELKTQDLPSLNLQFMAKELTDYLDKDPTGLRMWGLAYALNNNLSDLESWMYLGWIDQENILYPESIQKALINFIEGYSQIPKLSGSYPPTEKYGQPLINPESLAPSAHSIQLYLPSNLSKPEQINFFLTGVYWTRYYRLERNRLGLILKDFNLIDLYLITANPFERYPARKLLSYYLDSELYTRFGRIGNYYFPKNYSTKRQQLDGLVNMSVYRFGYFQVNVWERPVKLTFIYFSNRQKYSYKLNLDELIDSLDTSSGDLIFRILNKSWFLMPILRLAIMIKSVWPWLTDQDAWMTFFEKIQPYIGSFYDEYTQLHKNPFQLEETSRQNQKIILNWSDFLFGESVEQKYSGCLLCSKNYDQDDFGLCGHGVCISCQSLLGSVKCPFCSEHFTADNLSDQFIKTLINPNIISGQTRQKLLDRVSWIQNLKIDREFKFDWANTDVQIYP